MLPHGLGLRLWGKAPGGLRKQQAAGFSLFELVLVLAIIGVVASMAISRYTASTSYHGLEAAASRVVADLDLARRKAVALGTSRKVTFNAVDGTYTLDGVADINRPGQTYRVDLKSAPYEVNLRSVDVDGAGGATLTFDAYGRPVLADGTARQLNIVLSSPSRSVSVLVEPLTGRAHVQTGAP